MKVQVGKYTIVLTTAERGGDGGQPGWIFGPFPHGSSSDPAESSLQVAGAAMTVTSNTCYIQALDKTRKTKQHKLRYPPDPFVSPSEYFQFIQQNVGGGGGGWGGT